MEKDRKDKENGGFSEKEDDGVFSRKDFFRQLKEKCRSLSADNWCLTAVDVGHFRLFNKIYGRESGDRLIGMIKETLKEEAVHTGGLAGYMGADNFAILMPDEPEGFRRIREGISSSISEWSTTAAFTILLGVYKLDDFSVEPDTMYDRATLALSRAPESTRDHLFRFIPEMEEELEREVRLLRDIQYAIKNGEITFYVQPQCNIANRRIVGGEALARWEKDGRLIAPGLFVPALEKNGMIDQLDCFIWEEVCRWLGSRLKDGLEVVPLSVNVSRLDILSLDVPEYLFALMKKYDIPEKYLKIEITESAYVEENDRITYTVRALREKGFKVMMDDFGCGYSSLNMLKSIPVDVLKLDMRFLDIGENETERGVNILESVVNMARLLRLPIVVEGVETEKQEEYVRALGCRYTQGFYYYKPLPSEEFSKLLDSEEELDLAGMRYKQVEQLHVREFIDSNFISDVMLNNIMGSVIFYEKDERRIVITRVNEQYLRMIGDENGRSSDYDGKLWNSVRDDDRAYLYLLFQKAAEDHSGAGASGNIHLLKMDGSSILVNLRLFFLREKDGHRQFYASLIDVTEFYESARRADELYRSLADAGMRGGAVSGTNLLTDEIKKAYDLIPEGLVIQKIIPGDDKRPHDFEIVYFNRALGTLFCGDGAQIRLLALDAFGSDDGDGKKALDCMYRAAFKGETSVIRLYSTISDRYLEFTFYRQMQGYAAAIIRDVTNTYVSSTAMNSISLFYREIYFLQLQNNYYRMLYPDDNLVSERGSYGDAVNRHFYSGKICSANEGRIREFLAAENLIRAFEHSDKVELPYKRRYKEREEWCLTSITVSERSPDGRAKNAIMVIRSIDSLMKHNEDRRAEYLSEALGAMSDAFFIYHDTPEKTLIYANRAAAELYGCVSSEEFQDFVGNSFRGMVHPDDFRRIESELHDQITNSARNMDYIRYRILRRDGSERWVDDVGHFENTGPDTEGVFYVFLSDVSDEITSAQKNRLLARSRTFNKK